MDSYLIKSSRQDLQDLQDLFFFLSFLLPARREETKKTPSAYGGKKDLIMQCL